MGIEPTALCDLIGCSNHWATGDSMVSKGEMWEWNHIAQSHSQMMTWHNHMNSLTLSRSHIEVYQRSNQPPSKVSIIKNVQWRNIINTEKNPRLSLNYHIWTMVKLGNENDTAKTYKSCNYIPFKCMCQHFFANISIDFFLWCKVGIILERGAVQGVHDKLSQIPT